MELQTIRTSLKSNFALKSVLALLVNRKSGSTHWEQANKKLLVKKFGTIKIWRESLKGETILLNKKMF